jgi:hypothetical protein
MRRFFLLFPVFILVFSCSNSKEEAIEAQQRLHELQNSILQSESELQKQIAVVMEIQMDDSGKMMNDTSDIQLQREIELMNKKYDTFVETIQTANDSLKPVIDMISYEPLNKASLMLVNTYLNVAGTEYKNLLNLIAMPDSSYTEEKHEAYLYTTRELNKELDEALKDFNEASEKYAKKHGLR